MSTLVARLAMLGLLTAAAAASTLAQDAPPDPWKTTAELSWVQTGGNARSGSFGFKFESIRSWEAAKLTFRGFAVRAKVTDFTRFAVLNTDGSITLVENESERTSAEQYRFFSDYEHKLSARTFWMASAGWERNEPAGVADRYLAALGLGNQWIETDTRKWKTQYLATYTHEKPVLGDSLDFAGLRGVSDFWWKPSATTEFQDVLRIDLNLDDTDDWRAEWVNSLQVQMSELLALKVTLALFYDNLPSSVGVTLLDDTGVPVPGAAPVPFELDEFDYIFTTSLVINF